MKIEFKIDDMLRTVEGTGDEIIRVLTALGKIGPIQVAELEKVAELRIRAALGESARDAALTRRRLRYDSPFPFSTDYAALRAAVKTLTKYGFTYTQGAELWRPPLGERPYFAREENVKTYDSASWTGRS